MLKNKNDELQSNRLIMDIKPVRTPTYFTVMNDGANLGQVTAFSHLFTSCQLRWGRVSWKIMWWKHRIALLTITSSILALLQQAKGQLISKENYDVLNSSKKWFRSFIGRILCFRDLLAFKNIIWLRCYFYFFYSIFSWKWICGSRQFRWSITFKQ